MKVVWTSAALSGLNSAREYIAELSPGAAATVIERIETAVQVLHRHPRIGRPGRVAGTRELVVMGTPFIVVYMIASRRIEAVAFIHGAQRWP